jgi:hypothetical protein
MIGSDENGLYLNYQNSFLCIAFGFGALCIGSIFMSSWQCLEGCNVTAAVSTPPNSLGYFIQSRGPESAGYLILILLGLAFLYAIHGSTINTQAEDTSMVTAPYSILYYQS